MEILNTKFRSKYTIESLLKYIESINDFMYPLFESAKLLNYGKLMHSLKENTRQKIRMLKAGIKEEKIKFEQQYDNSQLSSKIIDDDKTYYKKQSSKKLQFNQFDK